MKRYECTCPRWTAEAAYAVAALKGIPLPASAQQRAAEWMKRIEDAADPRP